MAQQDLVPKTRFEKQIPFPILFEIAKRIKDFDAHTNPINVEGQFEMIQRLSVGLKSFWNPEDASEDLITLIAESIITLKLIKEREE
jgi:hypothetical protein